MNSHKIASKDQYIGDSHLKVHVGTVYISDLFTSVIRDDVLCTNKKI